MSDINAQLVREFLEFNRFYVLPHWHRVEMESYAEGGMLLFAERSEGTASMPVSDFILRPDDFRALERIVVDVRAWHGERFYPSLIEKTPVLGRLGESWVREDIDRVFNGKPWKSVLVVSEFSSNPDLRRRASDLLRSMGLDHAVEFSALLAGLAEYVDMWGNYGPSHTLQTIRLLKRYGMLRGQQQEFFFPHMRPGERGGE